jgi:hypothetical protein
MVGVAAERTQAIRLQQLKPQSDEWFYHSAEALLAKVRISSTAVIAGIP